MIKQGCFAIFLICLTAVVGIYSTTDQSLIFSQELAHRIGLQIWQNECAGKKEGLTTWNKGEDFASLGIGHFIWYPEKKNGVFKETFPDLLAFFKLHGVLLPDWLNQVKGCPWQTREEFQHDINEKKQHELRLLLADHVDLQILFMVQRLNKALSTILKYSPLNWHSHLTFQFYRLAATPAGLYALLDYLNFKGEGIALHESYQDQGWGLKQVLEQMQGKDSGTQAIEEFVEMAKKVLALRVEHAPSERPEKQWVKGWFNRLETYRHFSLKGS
jgi:hypothetical protein